ncbi:unnamed protein product [Diatraea saccharalis]|uniref:oleoyl-[acyl-carrier-protein] hydrolase n=1 Tax=Diatraea saccharalis TaxID=40085 RepID=A0A9N9R7N8_9NEOP|nr:unnamed protein product [Diatraea saccharalis]
MPIYAIPRYTCNEDFVYAIVGGLGGFGLELADWLILRGARKLVLTSRKGIANGYQSSRIRAWTGYGADVRISTHDITTERGCEEMLLMAKSMGHVDAIFNLAVVLKDSIFQNQTAETFKSSFEPKALATMHLDKFSKMHCPELRNFVVFSSVSCGRGNAGQTNYGFSNSVMERLCESRKKLGLPALAVQWGAIGDVGIVADMQKENTQIEIANTSQQTISSCLLTLDKFLKQDAPVVSSIVVAEKKTGVSSSGNIVDTIAQIMGIKDLKTISQQVSLAELGMDSVTAVEIKQTLEREYEIFRTAQDIRTLTFTRLFELTAQKEAAATTSERYTKAAAESNNYTFNETIGLRGEESIYEMQNILFVLPGIEGAVSMLEPLCKRLKIKVCGLQLGVDHKNETLHQMVHRLYQTICSRLIAGANFWILGYSFGTLLALELAAKLESEGNKGTVFCLDGAPDFLYAILTMSLSFKNEFQLLNSLLCHFIDFVTPNNNITKSLMVKLNEIESYDERVTYAIESSPMQSKYSKTFLAAVVNNLNDRLKVVMNYETKDVKKLISRIILLRPKDNPQNLVVEENYGLDKFTDTGVTIHFFEGNHVTIIENKDVADIINQYFLENDSQRVKPTENQC